MIALRESLEKTKTDDEFWSGVSEISVLSDVFVQNECRETIQTRLVLSRFVTDTFCSRGLAHDVSVDNIAIGRDFHLVGRW